MKETYQIVFIKNAKIIQTKHKFHSHQEALGYVEKNKLAMVSIQVHRDGIWQEIDTKNTQKNKNHKHSRKENLSFCFQQISLLLDSAIPLDEAIEYTQKISKHRGFEKALSSLSLGMGVADSFKDFGLSPLHQALLKVGEQSGKLQESFELIAKDLANSEHFKKRIFKVLFYPCVVFLSILVAFGAAVMVIIPEFASFFAQNAGGLPWITRSLLGIETFLKHFGPIVLLTIFLGIFAHLYFYRKHSRYKLFVDRWILKLGIFGRILLYSRLCTFLHALHFMQISGSDLKNSLEVAKSILDNAYLSLQISLLQENLSLGHSFSSSLESTLIFDDLTIGLIAGGEKSGNLDRMLLTASKRYRELCQDILDKLLLYVEPLCSLVLAILVLYLALGIFLPIWNLQDINLL